MMTPRSKRTQQGGPLSSHHPGIAPDHPQAYANKSICLRRKGDLAEAEVAATKAIELAPKAAGNYAGRGTVREQRATRRAPSQISRLLWSSTLTTPPSWLR